MQMKCAIDYSLTDEVTDSEIAALISLLAAKGETAAEISGVISALRARMVPVSTPHRVLDIVGTGGDGHDTVNISTAASVAAAAAGCHVAKHGNRSVSSKSGSADVLEALGVSLSLSPKGVARCVEEAGIAFMMAPNHHPCMKRFGGIRKALGIRTVFNVVGPFLNPCSAGYGVIGVYKPELLDIAGDVLLASGVEHAVVVHTEGLDEYSNTGVSQVIELRDGRKHSYTFDPEKELGMKRATIPDLRGGDANENAQILREVLGGKREDAITDAIALNAAVGCWVYGLDPSISQSLERVRTALSSGKALETMEKWAATSQAAASDGDTA